MGGLKMFMIVMVVMVSLSLNGNRVAAQVHHVVGGDRGWDLDTDLTSWLSGRNFSVGDKIWFVYSAAQGGIAEVKSKEEFEGCSMRNPIKLYTDGLVGISLDMEGTRYFASTNLNNCQSGLKLPVEVRSTIPKYSVVPSADDVVADGPTSPSSAATFCVSVVISMIGICLHYL